MFDIFVAILMVVCSGVLLYVGYRIGYNRGYARCYDDYIIGEYKNEVQI